jgi:uncharacterized membrane protein
MIPTRALRIILAVAGFGLFFSGFLSYDELFGERALSCPAFGAPGTLFGFPACVYGFFMYAAIVVIALLGLRRQRPA